MMEKINWFELITERLRDYSDGEIWTTEIEILCRTKSAVDAIADMLIMLYEAQGDEIFVNTGYYDPEEDEKNHELDRHTGWWYINIQ